MTPDGRMTREEIDLARRRAAVNNPLSIFEMKYCAGCQFHGTPHCSTPADRRAYLILCTDYLERRKVDTVGRARTAAAARWGGARGPSARIRVDEDVARDLESVPEAGRRAFASDAIRRALDARTGA